MTTGKSRRTKASEPETPARRTNRARHDRKTRRRGLVGEWVAATYLIVQGYRILERRYRTRHGEIDLIVRRGGTIAFVEVKVRPSLDLALLSISPRQSRRIVNAASLWLAGQDRLEDLDLRFDVIAVTASAIPAHVEGAFTSDDF